MLSARKDTQTCFMPSRKSAPFNMVTIATILKSDSLQPEMEKLYTVSKNKTRN